MEESQDWSACLERVGSHGDREAFSALFAHFAPLLKSFLAAGAGQNSENIEELVQETMVKVWRKASNYNRSQSNANTWIYTIARNTRIDWIRKQIRQNPNQLHADDIYDVMLQLHDDNKKITIKRVSELLNVSNRTVYRHMCQDLKREKELLNQQL